MLSFILLSHRILSVSPTLRDNLILRASFSISICCLLKLLKVFKRTQLPNDILLSTSFRLNRYRKVGLTQILFNKSIESRWIGILNLIHFLLLLKKVWLFFRKINIEFSFSGLMEFVINFQRILRRSVLDIFILLTVSV